MQTEALGDPQAEVVSAGGDEPRERDEAQWGASEAGTSLGESSVAATDKSLAPEESAPARAGKSATAPAPGAATPAAGAQRIPGLARAWQMPNRSWRPVTLGLEGMSEPPIGEEESELTWNLDTDEGASAEAADPVPPSSTGPSGPGGTGRDPKGSPW
jgi:hypothetical protein